MYPADIADALNSIEWATLRSCCTSTPDPHTMNHEAVEHLVKVHLLELQHDRVAITAEGRKVMVCGSPWLWNS